MFSIPILSAAHDVLAIGAIHAQLQFAVVIGLLPPHDMPNPNGANPFLAGTCADPFVSTLVSGLGVIINILMALGVAVAVIGIVVGGLMRATAWGSEQRIATSNKAITCAIVGLVIVLLGLTLGGAIPSWFGNANASCAP